jgi:choline-sulfatase
MNFVIFMPDEQQAEAAGCYGHPLVQTPNLDRLGREGTRFDQCYIQHPVCTPSRCSTFTGWYPHVAGHRTLWHMLRPHEPNLFRCLVQAGYDVRWYGKNDLLAAESFKGSVSEAAGPPAGLRNVGPREAADPADPRYNSFLAKPFPGGPWETADAWCVKRGIDYIRSRPAKPFMLYLPLVLPHPDYSAPQPWHDMYRPADLPPLRPPDLPDKPMFHRLIRRTRRLEELGEPDFRRIAAIYAGTITYVDYLFGELLAALDDTGLADDTCVIFCSDHGDWAGQFGLVEKWPSALDDTIARVPLVIRAGAKAAGELAAGHVVDSPVELFDIMATVLELSGAQARHTHFARSLLPQLRGEPGDAERAAFAEGGYDLHEPHCFEGRAGAGGIFRDASNIYYQKGLLQQTDPLSVCRTTMMRAGQYKLILRTADTCELYDLRADPRELRNLYGQPELEAAQRQLERRMLDWHMSTADVVPFAEDPRGLPAT